VVYDRSLIMEGTSAELMRRNAPKSKITALVESAKKMVIDERLGNEVRR
jgi:hypothetical protein